MAFPVQITWRNMKASEALEARIHALAEGLERFSSRIQHCHVVIEVPHKHGDQRHVYDALLQVKTPQGEFTAERAHRTGAHEDPYAAVRDAFRALRRQLEDEERRVRGRREDSPRDFP